MHVCCVDEVGGWEWVAEGFSDGGRGCVVVKVVASTVLIKFSASKNFSHHCKTSEVLSTKN